MKRGLICLLALVTLFTYSAALTFPTLVGRRWATGGAFTEVKQANGDKLTVGNFAVWNGTEFMDYDGGVNGPVNTVVVDTCRNLYVGGSFTSTTKGVATGPVAIWQRGSTAWKKIGSFDSAMGSVNAISVDCFNLPDIDGKTCNCDVWIAGDFTLTFKNKAGTTVTAINVAKWDANDNAWDHLGGNVAMPTGHGLDDDKPAYVVFKKDVPTTIIDSATKLVHVAGAGFYYQYDKKDKKWTDKTPDAVKNSNTMVFKTLHYDPNVFSTDKMFFGGSFDFPISNDAGASRCVNLCAYNKNTNKWSKLASSTTADVADPNKPVNSIDMAGTTLFVAGDFTNTNFKYLAVVSADGATSLTAATGSDATYVTEPVVDIDVCRKTDINCEKGSITLAGKNGLIQFYDAKSKTWNNFGNSTNPISSLNPVVNSVISWNYIGAASSLSGFTVASALAMIAAVLAILF